MTSLAELVQDQPDLSALKASKVLTWDIETYPALTWQYDLRDSFTSHKNVAEPGGMLAWGAKWLHEPGAVRYRDMRHPDMLTDLWTLLDEAAYVVTFNGDRFDLGKVRGYFAAAGLPPFRPPRSIDLIKTARTFGFESRSLDYTCRMFGVRRKVDNGGAANWRGCLLDDDPEAWRRMRTYCGGDVRATEDLYLTLLPWTKNHPVMGYPGDATLRCPRCLSPDHEDVGAVQAVVIRYRQHRCRNCGGIFRSTFHSRVSQARAL